MGGGVVCVAGGVLSLRDAVLSLLFYSGGRGLKRCEVHAAVHQLAVNVGRVQRARFFVTGAGRLWSSEVDAAVDELVAGGFVDFVDGRAVLTGAGVAAAREAVSRLDASERLLLRRLVRR
jgi:hypothetical protein